MAINNFEDVLLKRRNRIRNTIVLSAFAAICVVAYILTSMALQHVRQTIENQYIEDGKNLTRAYKITFQNMISQSYMALDMYAKNDVVRTGDVSQISKFFTSSEIVSPGNFLLMYYCDLNGDIYTTNGINANIADRDYFEKIMSGNYIRYMGKVSKSKTTGHNCIHISRAVFDKNQDLIGLLGATIELTYVQKVLESAQVSGELSPFIFDSDGACVSNESINVPVDAEKRWKEGVFVAKNSRGENIHVFIELMGDYNWKIGVAIKDSTIYATYNKLNMGQKVVFVIILIIGVLFYLFSIMTLQSFQNRIDSVQKRDPLTDLLNRTEWEHEANVLLQANPDKDFVCIDADFSGFKFINQTYGERIGTNTLVKFANTLKKIRYTYGGIIARGYADHFYYFNSITSLPKFMSALQIVQTGLKELSQKDIYPFKLKYGISFRFGCNTKDPYGASNNEKDGDSSKDVISSKDVACKKEPRLITQLIGEASIAKKTIKNSCDIAYAIYNSKMGEEIIFNQKIENAMEKALANDEFFVMYQPKINIATEKISGAEALVRWNSSEFGLLQPGKFIPIFENTGFIRKVDFAVYEIAFKFIRKRLDAQKPIIPISLNMSRSHTNTKAFMKELLRLTEKYSIPHNLVEIEILERSVANEKPILLEITNELHKQGFTVAMDDFGSGESSLNMLTNIPVDVLKFDQNFLRNNNNMDNSKQIIGSLITMAKQLKKKTVFEGVETESQRDFLKTTSVDYIQGYFYSKPLSEEDFVKFLDEHF